MVVGLSTRMVPVFTPVPETSTAIWLPKFAPVIVTVVLPPRRMVDGVTEVIFGPRTTERQPLHVPCLPIAVGDRHVPRPGLGSGVDGHRERELGGGPPGDGGTDTRPGERDPRRRVEPGAGQDDPGTGRPLSQREWVRPT